MVLSDIGIRSEIPSDEPDIRRLHVRAFGRTSEADLVSRLRKTPRFNPDLSLVAEFHRKIAGHVLLYPVQVRRTDRVDGVWTLALSPLGVEPLLQNQGIGSALVLEALARGRRFGYTSVLVLGIPEYYPRFGFRPASAWRIFPPFDVPDNNFMALELVPGELSGKSGIVEYPPEYDGI